MINKALIFDSSTIITLALNNLLNILEPLKNSFGGKFLITPDVKREIVDYPLQQKRFELESLMISNLLKKGVLEVSFPEGLEKQIKETVQNANSIFASNGDKIKILHEGEASCFALAKILQSEYKVFLAIDERTSRVLSEKPENLQKLFEKKLHRKISADKTKFPYFSGFNILRSAELFFIAYKKGLIELPAKQDVAIDALLYAAKFKGCSISREEIESAKALVQEM